MTPYAWKKRPSLLPMIVLILSLLAVCSDGGLARADDPMPASIRAMVEAPRYAYARWGLVVTDLASGKTLYALNPDTLFGPASVTKLFTAAAALDILGPDHVVRTAVFRTGCPNAAGLLKGDLILRAAGEPLSLAALRSLARQVRASGLRSLRGQVLVDDRGAEPYRLHSVARPGDLLYMVSPAMVQNNMAEILLRATSPGRPAALTLSPAGSALALRNEVVTVPRDGKTEIRLRRDGQGQMTVSGCLAVGSSVTRTVAVENPTAHLRSLFSRALAEAGVTLSKRSSGKPRLPEPEAYSRMEKAAERVSPPLKDLIKGIVKASANPGSDMLPLLMAMNRGKTTFEEGMALEKGLIVAAGIDPRAVALSDGSGLATANLVTPRSVVQLLRHMAGHASAEAFRDALPILGVDGTLADGPATDGPAKGQVRAKTGTIGAFDLLNDSAILQIKGLAGYVSPRSGRPLVFAVFVNAVHTTDARDRKAMLDMIREVGGDLNRIAQEIYLLH